MAKPADKAGVSEGAPASIGAPASPLADPCPPKRKQILQCGCSLNFTQTWRCPIGGGPDCKKNGGTGERSA